MPVVTDMQEYSKAVKDGAMSLFSEKYPPVVRVVSVQGYSTELCSGIAVNHTIPAPPLAVFHK